MPRNLRVITSYSIHYTKLYDYFENYDNLTAEERYQIVEYYYRRPFTWDNTQPQLGLADIDNYKEDEALESWLAYNISRSRCYADGLEVLEDFISRN